MTLKQVESPDDEAERVRINYDQEMCTETIHHSGGGDRGIADRCSESDKAADRSFAGYDDPVYGGNDYISRRQSGEGGEGCYPTHGKCSGNHQRCGKCDQYQRGELQRDHAGVCG